MDRTQHIYTKRHFLGHKKFLGPFISGIAIIPPVTFSGYVNSNMLKRVKDSLFDSHLNETEYQENIFAEKRYSMKYYYDFFNLFRNYNLPGLHEFMKYYIPTVNTNDQKIIGEELKKLEQVLKDSSVTNIKISDRLFYALPRSINSSSHYLLTDISEYYSSSHDAKSGFDMDYFLTKCFLVDVRNGSVIFYDYKIQKSHKHCFNNPPNIKRILRKLRHKSIRL